MEVIPRCDLCGEPEDQDPYNGREYNWNGETGNHLTCEARPYLIQVGRKVGKYKTKYRFSSPYQAHLWYSSINTGDGYKKRLLNGLTGEVIERYIS